MTKVSIQTLLDAGSHFGHQTRRWNPKMKPYIFGSRGDIYIIDLKQTLYGLDAAYTFVSEIARKGGTVLFVGTLDTNCDPDDVDFGIPAHDDAIRSVRLLADFVADAVIAGVGVPVTAAEIAPADAEAAPAAEAPAAVEAAPAEATPEAAAAPAAE